MTSRAIMRLVLVGMSALGLATPLAAQVAPGGRCELVFPNTPQTRFSSSRTATGGYNTFLGGGVVAECRGQNVTLRADSAEYYEAQGVLYLIGRVHYTEPRVTVDSRRATYYRLEERLVAEGDVDAVMPSGSRMRGPRVEYFRAVPGVRVRQRVVATNRPTLSLVEQDSTGRPQEPVNVIANQIVMDGDSLVNAAGRVEITRPDILATGDSAALDSGREWARLMRNPAIEGKRDRPFRLTGILIDLYSRQRQLERVISAGQAHAISEDLDLTADTIDLRVSQNRLQRAFAWGGSRARATSPENTTVADSLDVVMPDQRVREVRAIGRAFAESLPDSTRIKTTERDWLAGDTIVALFDTVVAADTSSRPRIRELLSVGSARSFYHIPPERGSTEPPSLNYVRGRRIIVAFANQQVQSVTVAEQAVGLYLEPATDTTATQNQNQTQRPRGAPARRTTGGGRP